jgi:hypothetical protein
LSFSFFTIAGLVLEFLSFWSFYSENSTTLHEKRRGDAEAGAGGPPLDAPAPN